MKKGWTTKKPKFKEPCLLLTACLIHGKYEYETYVIDWVVFGENRYMGWLTGDGGEYGSLEDLKSELYRVLPLLKNKLK